MVGTRAQVPERPWTDPARETLYAVYRHWAANGRPPSVVDLHAATGLDARQLRQAFVELSDGLALAFPEERVQLTILKAPPYSAVPTPVACWIDGEFHAYLGCPAEAMTIARLPLYDGKPLQIRTACTACFSPIELVVRDDEIVSAAPDVRICVSTAPWEWGKGPIDRVCDAFHFVCDESHARRLETLLGRRCVVATPAQIQQLGARVAARRMRDPQWGPVQLTPEPFIRQLERSGVDVGAWR